MFMYIPLKEAEVTRVNRVLILLQSNLCTTATFGKWQGDSYIQVNFAGNIKQLKILGSFSCDCEIQGDCYIQGRCTGLNVVCSILSELVLGNTP